ncbi:MAG TPA: 2-hydroxyacyl-CoA dehydratase [Candidatus Sumerlaeota bacterium]|nr:MAG: 2-hydroxyglutaryl-CoA dehydratase, D-component [candidate division BRC1 bacterium ADurb.Bin183]HOE63970.1 2-hydroxyacyl-CoA dehydratase [Candidatus Sumerlaeota bacterium]HRR98966.1 2-hydroxyacyl-CoA dehydratase [Candidatus Sumerlaeia bacterium]HON50796.1 2-hydroxyacyl-CoA dehydratase [Candidatus Sumerlaeota bacterium]HOR65490.1 2-hydroxyacyl-CoA dehydratase [Candidatus Sumerlaeota bacterium]
MSGIRTGFTTTLPVEIILAAGDIPVDLNNIFVGSSRADEFIQRAEKDGYPRNLCAWIKGIYGVAIQASSVDRIIIVTEGDCSNTFSMLETFQICDNAPNILTFNFPRNREASRLELEMERLAREVGTTIAEAEKIRIWLKPLREKLSLLDRLTWQTGQVTGGENHFWLVSSSDFWGNPFVFEKKLDEFLKVAMKRSPNERPLKIAIAGVPPIFSDLHDYLNCLGVQVVLNEMQRQFSMPNESGSLIEQYLSYTYPYDSAFRIKDLNKEIKKRGADGLIHYVQAFCHRGIEDMILRHELSLPILTLEGDRPGALDARTCLRLDTFIEMLKDIK